MQPINEDMDELYRRAADEYPLNAGSGNWDAVVQKMEAAGDKPGGQKDRGKRRMLWLLLLLPLFFICNRFTQPNNKIVNAENFETKSVAEPEINKVNKEEKQSGENDFVAAANKPNSTDDKKFLTNRQRVVDKNVLQQQSDETSVSTNKLDEKAVMLKQDTKQKLENPIGEPAKNQSVTINAKPINDAPKSLENVQHTVTSNSIDKSADGAVQNSTSFLKKDTDSTTQVNPYNTTQEIKPKAKKLQTKRTYVGLVFGPDLSTIKSSKINGVGYSAGILLGYRFARKFSLETGALWDRKKYQSKNGADFNTQKLNWPSHTKLLEISGYCDMIEIPLTIRYDVFSLRKFTWFATAGTSSYIMKKEDYQYRTERYGNYYNGKRSYANSSTSWFSMLHLSAGFEKTIGRIGKLRVEPYIKLPTQGVGLMSMPLRSTGVYLGITRPIR